MKLLAAFLSLICVLWLAIPFWFTGADEQSGGHKSISTTTLKIKQNKVVNPLVAQWQDDYDAWQAELKQKETDKDKAQRPAAKQVGQLLTMGGQTFNLLGVFKQNRSQFALFKDEAGTLKKVTAGEQIADGVILVKVTTNSVTLNAEQQTKEFKLFKRLTTDAS